MNSKLKKTLIIISSSVVLFFSVFYLTRSLNNLVEAPNKENVVSLEDSSSQNTEIENKGSKETSSNKEDSEPTNNISVDQYTEFTDYIVQEGDTLFSIARNKIPWKSQDEATKILQAVNNLKNRELLSVGSKLKIPANTIDTSNCVKYVVKEGESIYTIAESYLPNMNIMDAVDLIMKKNNITESSALSIGLEIYIPNADASAVNSNSVKSSKKNTTNNTEEDYVDKYVDEYIDKYINTDTYTDDTDNE